MIQEVRDNKFIVVRLPRLMEDEGNWHVLAICDTRQDVAQFCKEYTESDTGYFKVSDLVYIGSHFSSAGGQVTSDLQSFLPLNIREYHENIRR
jgi:hypothetical protein